MWLCLHVVPSVTTAAVRKVREVVERRDDTRVLEISLGYLFRLPQRLNDGGAQANKEKLNRMRELDVHWLVISSSCPLGSLIPDSIGTIRYSSSNWNSTSATMTVEYMEMPDSL